MSQAASPRLEVDGMDRLFESIMEKTNAEASEWIMKDEEMQNMEDNISEKDVSNAVETPSFEVDEQPLKVTNQIETNEQDSVKFEEEEEEEEEKEEEEEETKNENLQPFSLEKNSEMVANEDYPGEPNFNNDEDSVGNPQQQIDQQIRRLRFRDEVAPLTRFNNRGLRRYKKLIGSIKKKESQQLEYSKVDLPAHKAAWDGNVEMLEEVYAWKTKEGVPCVDRHGATPLHLAARRNHLNVIR